jgi:hypothetical protein
MQIPARDFQAVNESCLMVGRNSGQARGHKACPVGETAQAGSRTTSAGSLSSRTPR